MFLKACKRVWHGLSRCETDFSYHLPPTSHVPAQPKAAPQKSPSPWGGPGWVLLAMQEPNVECLFTANPPPTTYIRHPAFRIPGQVAIVAARAGAHAAPLSHGLVAAKGTSLPLGRGGVGVVGDALIRKLVAAAWPAHIPLPTPHILVKPPPAASQPPPRGEGLLKTPLDEDEVVTMFLAHLSSSRRLTPAWLE